MQLNEIKIPPACEQTGLKTFKKFQICLQTHDHKTAARRNANFDYIHIYKTVKYSRGTPLKKKKLKSSPAAT
jgi:hypothetical protein